jgi:tRNA pseudouridine55 synthase
LDKDEKEYEALVRFGFETDTGDRTGVRSAEWGVRSEEEAGEIIRTVCWDEVLSEFRGEIEQVPPMYSAKKVDGKKLYEHARKGETVDREAVRVTIHELSVSEPPGVAGGLISHSDPLDANTALHQPPATAGGSDHSPAAAGGLISHSDPSDANTALHQPPATAGGSDHAPGVAGGLPLNLVGIRVLCSAGTYIRTLAEDIGKKLGTGAHLSELRRTRAGKFSIGQAITLEQLDALPDPATSLIPMNESVSHLPKFVLQDDRIDKTRNGMSTRVYDHQFQPGELMQIVTKTEELIAIGFYNEADNCVQPKVVLV